MKKRDAIALERKLCAAMEAAIEAGWYPKRGTYASGNGGCCAIGASRIIDGDEFTDSLPINVIGSIQVGFDGMPRTTHDRHAYTIGKRMAKRYLVQE